MLHDINSVNRGDPELKPEAQDVTADDTKEWYYGREVYNLTSYFYFILHKTAFSTLC